MLADSDEANKGFLEEQPNFLPDNDREIVQNLIEQSNTHEVAAEIEPFGTKKVEETPATDIYERQTGQEIVLEDGSTFVVDNDEEPEPMNDESETEEEAENTADLPDAGKEVEEVANYS